METRAPAEERRDWLLVVDPPAGERGETRWIGERILGVPTLLRLALTAQGAGAAAVVLAGSSDLREARSWLGDPRLRLAVIDEADRPSLLEYRARRASVRVPANAVVHRATLAATAERAGEGEIAIPSAAAVREAGGVYGFEPIAVDSPSSARAARDA